MKRYPLIYSCLIFFTLSSVLFFSACSSSSKKEKSPQELAELYTDLGTAALMRDEYPEAVENLRKAIMLDSTNSIAHNHLGLAYYGLGQRDLAKQSVNRAVLENGKYSDAHINLGNFAFEEKNYTLAKLYYQKALDNLEYKFRHRALTSMAQIHLAENNIPQAKKYLEDSIAVNPDFCLTHFLIGTVCNRENDTACAAKAFAKSVAKVCVSNPEGHYQLGLANLRLKQYAKAKNAFMFLVESFPQTVQAQRASEKLRFIP